MKEFWICLLLAVAAGANVQKDVSDDYDLYDHYDILKDFLDEYDSVHENKVDDYQIEDNRSDLQDDAEKQLKLLTDPGYALSESNEEKTDDSVETLENIEEILGIAGDFGGLDENEENKEESAEKDSEEKKEESSEKDSGEKEGDITDGMDSEENQDDKYNEMEQESNSQSEEIVQNDNNSLDDNGNEDNIHNQNEENDFFSDEIEDDQRPVPDDIMEETKQILEDTDDNFDEVSNEAVLNEDIEEDTVEKVQNDLEDDLKKLAETIDKLSSDLEPEEDQGSLFDPAYESDDSVETIQNENEENVDDDDDDKEFSDNDDSIDHVADEDEKFDDSKELWRAVPEEKIQETKEAPTEVVPTTTEKDLNNLSAEEYDRVMADFQTRNAAQLDVSNEMDRNIIPERITLSLDEATTVTSPNYPLPYPTNNVQDWVFTGDGMGIELNITDFFVNGIMGDYLLIIPGGIDSTETDGLVFSYRLLEGRRYRFFDVDRMFVRFESNPGMAMARGFSFSAKMILPRMDRADEIPEPQPVAPKATETLTLFIGGLTLPEFRSQQEAFRQIIADMATLYINANEIQPGFNATIDTTQITRTAACNVEWPGYEECTAVSFGVPLMYDEEMGDQRLNEGDLRAMWYLYSGDDPFAARITRLGMTEFEVPNDSSILAVWAVVGAGVVICMAVLAFALWRFSCLENYTRMPQYSDRDSVYSEKRGLDLYPTPHQTLPPLYADNEYKWDDGKFDDSARVDMGGFANKSYARDMYDIDSDEEVITAHDRNTGIAPRDKFDV